MRISITDRCNLRCRYCMPEETDGLPREEMLSYGEICRVAVAAVGLGITHFRITGGEPLVRRDCAHLVKMLREIPGIESIHMTTNGMLLPEKIGDLAQAGLDGVNISLDTRDREQYAALTGRDGLPRVLEGIRAALDHGIMVKLNAVNQRGTDWRALTEYAERMKIPLRFIEMMPIGYGRNYMGSSNEELLREMEQAYGTAYPVGSSGGTEQDKRQLSEKESRSLLTEKPEGCGNGPARYYRFEKLSTKIGFISAINRRFCESCNRIRLTADGYLKACLCYEQGIDLRPILRDTENAEQLQNVMREVIYHKPKEHSFEVTANVTEKKAMHEIGG